MPVLTLETKVEAPVEIVFDLARSIDLHKLSTAETYEDAIAGRTSGLISMGESVTWRAKHFGIWQQLTSRITAFNSPHSFTDEMVAGAFKSFRHDHLFVEEGNVTTMTDVFSYTSPLGIIGKIADSLFLKKYMYNLLVERNRVLKEVAEDLNKRDLLLLN